MMIQTKHFYMCGDCDSPCFTPGYDDYKPIQCPFGGYCGWVEVGTPVEVDME